MEEEASFHCNLVDCTLSLGSSTVSRGEIPARLSRAGSPDHDLAWSLALRSDPSRAHTCEQDPTEAMSWRGSCDRSDSLDYFPQVSEARASDRGRSKAAPWPKSATTSKPALFSLSYSNRQAPWLSHYIPSSAVVEAKGTASECRQEGDRVCAHCNTSKTPLWRNGPNGPKSLCNACGIRYKKAGRRCAANGSSESPPSSPRGLKRKVVDEHYWVFPRDARRSVHDQSGCYSSDEEEGAVLLMALSCGVVNA